MERILIAEDDDVSRSILESFLENWGYEVISTTNGNEAWEALRQEDCPRLAILDWVMPGKNGIELCRKFRKLKREKYVYILLLTAKDHSCDIVQGLQSGADDYITKPFDQAVLQARINVGFRVIELERVKTKQLKEITKTNEKLQRDLEAAALIQMNFLPKKSPSAFGFNFNWIYEPSEALGGDMLHIYRLDENQIVVYVLDVSGHGTQAALLSVTIRNQLSEPITQHDYKQSGHKSNLTYQSFGDPLQVVTQLAKHYSGMLSKIEKYFTLLYGVLNIQTGEFKYVRAGHLPPIVVGASGARVIEDESEGLPIGMYDDFNYDEISLTLMPGEKMFLLTDGLLEGKNSKGHTYGIELLLKNMEENALQPKGIQVVVENVRRWMGRKNFDDDVAVLEINRH